MSCYECIASAPGKLILFGEHAVVYGREAIAASLDQLRLYVHLVNGVHLLEFYDMDVVANCGTATDVGV